MDEATETLALAIRQRLDAMREQLAMEYQGSTGRVRTCFVDDLLPDSALQEFSGALPPLSEMTRLRSLGERKFVSASLDRLAPALRKLTMAFSHPIVTLAIAPIIGAAMLVPDGNFYNGGVTIMAPGDFMRPHLDNSHDKAGQRVRKVVMLYYFSPVWRSEYGGHLAVWDDVVAGEARGIKYRPNRLVLIETSEASWHSISEIVGPYPRVNLTTYLYDPAATSQPVRLTRFKAWPKERLHLFALDAQFHARSMAFKLGLQRFRRNPHVYENGVREKA